jgi:hypothetical protein
MKLPITLAAAALGLFALPALAQPQYLTPPPPQPAVPQPAPGGPILGYIDAVNRATTAQAAVSAYQSGNSIDPKNVPLKEAFVNRMLQLGQPELAADAARELIGLDTARSGAAWGVVAYVDAMRGDMVQGLMAITGALQLAPNEPFILQTAGLLYAWYDAQDPRPVLADIVRQRVEALRTWLNGQSEFTDAYAEASRTLADQAAAAAPPPPQPPPQQPYIEPPVYTQPSYSYPYAYPYGYPYDYSYPYGYSLPPGYVYPPMVSPGIVFVERRPLFGRLLLGCSTYLRRRGLLGDLDRGFIERHRSVPAGVGSLPVLRSHEGVVPRSGFRVSHQDIDSIVGRQHAFTSGGVRTFTHGPAVQVSPGAARSLSTPRFSFSIPRQRIGSIVGGQRSFSSGGVRTFSRRPVVQGSMTFTPHVTRSVSMPQPAVHVGSPSSGLHGFSLGSAPRISGEGPHHSSFTSSAPRLTRSFSSGSIAIHRAGVGRPEVESHSRGRR